MEREVFIKKVLNSVDGIKKATPDDGVFLRINQQIKQYQVSQKMIWLVAASVAILIAFNIILLNDTFKNDSSELLGLKFSIDKSNQLYK